MGLNTYEKIYAKLDKLEIFDVKEYERRTSNGFMDLNIDCISKNVWALSHNYEANGDIVPDPDMEIRADHNIKMAEALSYQDQHTYSKVYPEPGKVNPRTKRELNKFLNSWLDNLIEQGFEKK